MAERVQLNEENLDEVTGGKFTFYTDLDGNPRCKVTGFGRYQTTSDGFFKYITLKNSNPNATESELVQMALDQHIIW